MTGNVEALPQGLEPTGEIDLRALGQALRRKLRLLLTVALAACVLIAIAVNVIPARYTAQSQVLLENQETFFTRPDRVNTQPAEQASQLDPEAVASQVQLITSRDIARQAIKELGLEGNDEFDPLANGMGAIRRVMVLLGLMRDPTRETRDARIVTAFLDKLVVYSPPKTRVIAIEFTSRDPVLAARAANIVASLYLKAQSTAKRQMAQETADALGAQIADLRTRLVKADDAREQYRLKTGLLAGSNNMTITGQQLADINTDLSRARSAQADAQAKAQMIRDLLRRGLAADVPDVINNDTVRRIAEQRVQVQGQLALEARTLLPEHPRIKALTAQVQEYDHALKAAAKQAATTLENEAAIAGTRVRNIETMMAQQKTLAGTANVDEIHLHALEQTADSLKAQLESSTTKYQEALARANSDATPADARIIQSAVPPQEASFPKKLPFIVFGTVAVLALAVGTVVAGELMGTPAPEIREPVPVVAVAAPPAVEPRPEPAASVPHRGWAFRRAHDVTPPALVEDEDPVFAATEEETRRRPHALAARLKALGAAGLFASVLAWGRGFAQSAAASRATHEAGEAELIDRDEAEASHQAPDGAVHWDPVETSADAPMARASDKAADAVPALADHIAAAHVPGHGLHVVGTGIELDNAPVVIALARALATRGRSIIVDLNRTPVQLAPLTRGGADERAGIASLIGLSELLVGQASFAEVIHRDHASRLHFLPTGRQEADFRDFDLILDALTATYDFIVLLAPAYPQSEVAKIMAPYADFVVLAPGIEPDTDAIRAAERDLSDAGAKEILVVGRSSSAARRDVA